jgi:hypothetical protein
VNAIEPTTPKPSPRTSPDLGMRPGVVVDKARPPLAFEIVTFPSRFRVPPSLLIDIVARESGL